MQTSSSTIPWRERAFLTMADTAAIFARSPSWIRERIADGELETMQFAKGGPRVVTVKSAATLFDQLQPARKAPTVRVGPWPRLVWIHPEFRA